VRNTYADIVISCGSSATAANVFLKYENNAKNIVIMKPCLGRDKKMDLIILPRHDARGKVRRNELIIEGAPNRITELKSGNNNGIGLLIGGDAKGFRLKKEDVEKVVDEVIKISEEKNLDIFLSTSRRTSPQIDKLLKEKLGNNKRCKLLIIANEKNIEGAVANIFGLSELVVISQESMSMISEAASSGRYVIVFRFKEKDTKYDKMVSNLEKNGYINTARPDEIHGRIKEILETRPEQKRLDDREKIIDRLRALV
jgi:mitochondrial fission protein ELM1